VKDGAVVFGDDDASELDPGEGDRGDAYEESRAEAVEVA